MIAALPPTARQLDVLDYIKEFTAHNRVSPTIQEIADHLGVSKVSAWEHVGAMIKKGMIVKTAPHASRSLRVVETCPACGRLPEGHDGPRAQAMLQSCVRLLGRLSRTLPPRYTVQIDQLLDQLQAAGARQKR